MTRRLGRPRLGVIGGLGPLASADFYRKFTDLTPAVADTDHVPLALLSLPDLPDRTEAILAGSDVLVEPLLDAVAILDGLGVECIAMPCNTAHHWFDRLSAASSAEIVHIVDSVVTELRSVTRRGSTAVLATRGTLASGFYQTRLLAEGYEVRDPAAPEFQPAVDAAIAGVKAGDTGRASEALRLALRICADERIDAAILACTELSVLAHVADAPRPFVVDSNTALARACLRRLGVRPRSAPGWTQALSVA